MATTRTGSFGIGFRRLGGGWQQDLATVMDYAKANDFVGFDVKAGPVEEIKQILDAGLRVGSVDLRQPWTALTSADAGVRKAAAQEQAAYINEVAALSVKNFFAVALPEDAKQPRQEIFKQAVDGYGQVCDAIKGAGARIVFEGWPGNAGVLACTPADYRAWLNELPAEAAGVNFDPSHLVRMFIDPVPFVEEFASRVYHVHGKDTEIDAQALQEHGSLLPATFAKTPQWGGTYWRYTIPGHGITRWTECFRILADAGYDGMVSIELEDQNFNGSEEGTKRGFAAARDALASF